MSDKIEFPDKCVFCNKVNPDGVFPLSPPDDDNNGITDKMLVYAVPACKACAYSSKDRGKLISNVAYAIFLIAFTVFGSWLLKDYYYLIYISLGIFVVMLLLSLDALNHRRMKIQIEDVNDSKIFFALSDSNYAVDFKSLNQDSIIHDK